MKGLWSYLGWFSRMTKDLRSSHREDILSRALLYYALMSEQKLGKGFESIEVSCVMSHPTHIYTAQLLLQHYKIARGLQSNPIDFKCSWCVLTYMLQSYIICDQL